MFKTKSKEKIVLIESEYFEYLTKENEELTWKQIKIEGLPFIPVIITPSIQEQDNRTIYNLYYELPYTHEYIMTSNIDTIVIDKNLEDNTTHTTHIKMPNNNYDNATETPIRLNNQYIDITKKLNKKNDIPLEYISKKRKEIFKLTNTLDKSASLLINNKIKIK